MPEAVSPDQFLRDRHEVIRRVHQHLTAQKEPAPQPSSAAVPDGYAEADLAVLLGKAAR